MNTAINAETVVNTTTTAAVETANSELQILKAVQEDENASIQDYVGLAQKGFYDNGFVNLLEDIADNVAKKMEPKNYDAEIAGLQTELLATKDIAKRFGIMEKITQLMNEQQGEGSEIRNRLAGVGFHEIAVAYAKDIQGLVDGVILEMLKKGQYQVLKSKRAPKDGVVKVKAAAEPAEQITFEAKGKTFVIKAGKGRLSSDLLEIAVEHAKAVKDEEAQKKPNFIAALKEGKVKGAKVIKVEVA